MENRTLSRPAVWIGFTYFAALLTATFVTIAVTPYLLGAAVLMLLVLLACRTARRNPAPLVVCLTVICALSVFNVMTAYNVLPPQRYANSTGRIEGEVLSEGSKPYDNFLYTVRVRSIDGTPQDASFIVRLSHGMALDAEIGDTVLCDVRFNRFEEKLGLSSRTSQLADGKVLSAYIIDYETVEIHAAGSRTLPYYLAKIRGAVRDSVCAAYPKEEAAVLCAMLIGDRNNLSDALNESYRDAGASHILVISGMHMAIVAQFLLAALRFLGLKRRAAPLLTMLFVFGFMLLSGMQETVVRSGVMQLIYLLGLAVGRRADALNSLAIASLVLLLVNPFCVGDISFLLSFSATLGIIQLQPRLLGWTTHRIQSARAKKWALRLLSPLMTALAAVCGSLPVQLYVFGSINLSSLLSSVLVLYLSAWLVRVGLFAALAVTVPVLQPMAPPLVLVSGLLARFQNVLVRFVASFPMKLELYGAYLVPAVLFGVLLVATAFALRGSKRLKLVACGMAAFLLVAGMASNAFMNGGVPRIAILRTDFAACTALVDDGSAVVLYCSGNETDVAEFLHTLGVQSIELLHVDGAEDAIRCGEALLRAFPVGRVVLQETVYFPSAVCETYDYASELSLGNGRRLAISSAGKLVTLEAEGNVIVLESGDAGFPGVTADLLVTNNLKTNVNSPFTVLCADGIIEEIAETLATGDYVLAGSREQIYVELLDGGFCAVYGG